MKIFKKQCDSNKSSNNHRMLLFERVIRMYRLELRIKYKL